MLAALGILMGLAVLVLAQSTWPPRGSVPRTQPGWTRIPLIAFAVFAVGPSVLAPVFYALHSAGADLGQYIGPFERPPRLDAVLFEPLVLSVGLWPFLTLYGVTQDKLIRGRPSPRSVRLATILSVALMSVPSTFLLFAAPQEMMSSAPDAGQGTGILCFVFMLFLPIPGVVGWYIGQGIAWMRD